MMTRLTPDAVSYVNATNAKFAHRGANNATTEIIKRIKIDGNVQRTANMQITRLDEFVRVGRSRLIIIILVCFSPRAILQAHYTLLSIYKIFDSLWLVKYNIQHRI